MKKIWIALALTVTCALCLTGCGSPAEGGETDAQRVMESTALYDEDRIEAAFDAVEEVFAERFPAVRLLNSATTMRWKRALRTRSLPIRMSGDRSSSSCCPTSRPTKTAGTEAWSPTPLTPTGSGIWYGTETVPIGRSLTGATKCKNDPQKGKQKTAPAGIACRCSFVLLNRIRSCRSGQRPLAPRWRRPSLPAFTTSSWAAMP